MGVLAESEGHHPAILTQWGSVTVTWWTHKIRGLHRNDFIMAANTDRLAAELPMTANNSALVLSWRNPCCRVQRDCVQDCFRNAHHFRSFINLNKDAALLLFTDG